MKITINGELVEFQETSLTIEQLLKLQNVQWPDMVTVEHNNSILERSQLATTQVKDGDEIELLYYMGGGG